VTRTIWRLEKSTYADAVTSGEGARRVGGRWTSPGLRAVYCAERLSLAILEVIVHAPNPSERRVPRVRFRVELADALVDQLPLERLPEAFSPRTPYAVTQEIGDDWLRDARRPALAVPSAIVPAERTYILNPLHPAFDRIAWGRAEPISLDDRLWMTGSTVR
jgi:RES domain-containing protein